MTLQTADTDLERRLRHAQAIVVFMAPFAAVWGCVSLWLGAYVSAAGAFTAVTGFVLATLLRNRMDPVALRVMWLLFLDVAMFLAIIATHPASYTAFLLLFRATAPISVFSPRESRIVRWGLVLPPVVIWFVTWALDYQILPEFEIGEAMAHMVFAPISGVTIFGILLFEFAYYDRLTSLYMSQLEEARQLSDQANQAKSRFLKSLTHNMRTPLHTISGYSDMIRSEIGAGKVAHSTELEKRMTRVLAASQELLGMIDKGIALSSMTSDGVEALCRPVQPGPLMHQVLTEMHPVAQAKAITLSIDGPDATSEPEVLADPDLLVAALRHLVENAIRFSPEQALITVACAIAPNNHVELSVCDTGPGFPPGSEEAAFVPFERLGEALGASLGGGIGLTLIKAQVEAMGGTVGIDDAYKDGARVWIRLPRA